MSVKESWLEFIERYREVHAVKSRSEVIERGLAALEQLELQKQYHAAYKEWAESGEQEVWEVTAGDGLE